MPDIYGFNAQHRGIGLVTARDMILRVSTADGTTLGDEYLVQNVSIQYNQPIQTIRELSTPNGYYHALPPQGVSSLSRIVGSRSIKTVLGSTGSGIWVAPNENEQNANTGRTVTVSPVTGKSGPTYVMQGCIIENYSLNMDANSSLLVESVQIRFGLMEEK